MLTLALDTSTGLGGVAVLKNATTVLSSRTWRREKSHSEYLTAAIAECLTGADVKPQDLKRIAVGRGPGSFTGIRIAVNAARTLGYSLNLPIYAFDTLEILASGAQEKLVSPLPVLTLVNAHKNLLYVSYFESKNGKLVCAQPGTAANLNTIVDLITEPCLVVGDGFEEWSTLWPASTKANMQRLADIPDEPQPDVLGRLALNSDRAPIDWNHLQPFYIRASEPEEKFKAGLLKDRSKLNE